MSKKAFSNVLTNEEFEDRIHDVLLMPPGFLKSAGQKLMLSILLHYHHEEAVKKHKAYKYHHDGTISVDYQKFKDACSYYHFKTLLKDLSHLHEVGLITLKLYKDKGFFDVLLNIKAICNAPKLKEFDHVTD